MGVRFILGRAGSGKTHHCLEAIRAAAREDPLNGPRLVFLVPEQAAQQMERAILAPSAGGAACAHRVDVVSFRRLAFRVLESTGAADLPAVSDLGRTMVLRLLLSRHAEQLEYFGRSARRSKGGGRLSGTAEKFGAAIAELMQEGLRPEDLESASALCADAARAARMRDVARLLAAYRAHLGDRHIDDADHLPLAAARFVSCDWLRGARVWVDGFASMSRQEVRAMVELARIASSTEITALVDPAAPGLGNVLSSNPLFRKIHATYQRMSSALLDAGCPIEPPLVLRADPPPRFASARPLAQLERCLFEDAATPSKVEAAPAVSILPAATPREEVDRAVAQVLDWLSDRQAAYRYRDVAIIARDLAEYDDLLSAALTTRSVPFFIDQRRRPVYEPLLEYVRACGLFVRDPFALDTMRVLLKTELLVADAQLADELENHLLATGLTGESAWRKPWTSPKPAGRSSPEADRERIGERAARLNEARAAIVDHFQPLLHLIGTGPHTGSEWSAAIEAQIHSECVMDGLERLAERDWQRGDMATRAVREQLWRDLHEFLREFAATFQRDSLSADDLVDVLETGLGVFTIGLAPPMVDQVLVGSIERSRHPPIKAAVILGFSDGNFPQTAGEDPILGDAEREVLSEASLRIGDTARDRTADEALLAYIALTRASERLAVCFPRADEGGKERIPSPYLGELERLLSFQHGTGKSTSSERIGETLRCEPDFARALALHFRARAETARTGEGERRVWNALYDERRDWVADSRLGRRATAGLGAEPPLSIPAAHVAAKFGDPMRMSVSRLEDHAACPFRAFARGFLHLAPRELAQLEPTDVGSLHHAVLETFLETGGFDEIARYASADASIGDELLCGLQDALERIEGRLATDAARSTWRDAYLSRRSQREIERVLRRQGGLLARSRFRPRHGEKPFGFGGEDSLPPLELTTPKGRRVLLRGYIDRIDIAEIGDEALGIVIDYKRSADKRLPLDHAHYGLSLQLLAYLLVLAQHGRTLAGRTISPVAGLYIPVLRKQTSIDHPSEVDRSSPGPHKDAKARGIISVDRREVLADDDAVINEHLAAKLTKAGAISDINKSDLADREHFDSLLARTMCRMGELCDDIFAGNVEVRPVRLGSFSACSWCDLRDICRFDIRIHRIRLLDPLARSDVFDKLSSS